MTSRKYISVPKWALETIENTLRIQENINFDERVMSLSSSETCQDRNVKESLIIVRKLLNGEELTGNERFENYE